LSSSSISSWPRVVHSSPTGSLALNQSSPSSPLVWPGIYLVQLASTSKTNSLPAAYWMV
jgi:hypothetical protein